MKVHGALFDREYGETAAQTAPEEAEKEGEKHGKADKDDLLEYVGNRQKG